MKLQAGETFPTITVNDLAGNSVNLNGIEADHCDWKLVVVYRGQHCPMCTRYLNILAQYRDALLNNGIDMVAVSADSKEQLKSHLAQLDINFPIAYGLTLEQMQSLGLYISEPRSEKETDHNFAEPGLFVINEQGTIQVIDTSNNPFVRPEVDKLVSGLQWIRNPENNYPIRGMYRY